MTARPCFERRAGIMLLAVRCHASQMLREAVFLYMEREKRIANWWVGVSLLARSSLKQ